MKRIARNISCFTEIVCPLYISTEIICHIMFVYIKRNFDKNVVKLCHKLIVTRSKVSKKKQLIEFLKLCIIKMVIPKWILFRINNSKLKVSSKIENLFLRSEISKIEKSIKYLESEILFCSNELKKVMSVDYEKFGGYVKEVVAKQKEKIQKENNKKIENLINLKFGTLAKYNVLNLSNRKLTEQEKFALSLGINFSLPPTHVDKETVFLGFESFYKQLCKLKPRSNADETSTKVNLTSLAYNYCKLKPEENKLFDFSKIRNIIKELKKDDKLLISKPDKGNGCVLLNKSDYLHKMLDIIGDSRKFKLLGCATKFDNVNKVENEITKFLKQLLDNKEITEDIFNLVKPVGSITPRMYGLPKIHKEGIPLRPILSMVKSAQHKLAKFLNCCLEPVLEYYSAYTLKDSFTFVDKIKDMDSNNSFVASFDVKSLFTNVPLEEVIEICINKLYEIDKPKMNKNNFKKLLQLSTRDVQFSFNSQIYSQKDGIAMGSPLGPTLANIFMGYVESKIIRKFKHKLVYFRYVDDCFVLVKNEMLMEKFFDILNNAHSSIKFTMEKENNNELAYLDVIIKRKNNRFLTSVFRKKTFTGNYLNFQSSCSVKRKINLIRTLCHRAYKICSPELLTSEINQIKLLLNKNGYPKELINKTIKLHLNSLDKRKKFGPEKCVVTLKLPFINKNSRILEKNVKQLIKNTYNAADPRIILTSKPLIQPSGKDPISPLNKSMVIYQFSCFCKASYIGLTSRQLAKRIKEHIPKSVERFCDLKNKDVIPVKVLNASKRSSIAEHLTNNPTCATNYNLNRFRIIKNCNNIFDLIKLEAICILLRKPILCKQKDFDYTVSLFS